MPQLIDPWLAGL